MRCGIGSEKLRQLGYLKVTVHPAKNRATAQEIFVAWVEEDDSETATVYDPPVIGDVVTFPLKKARRSSEWSNSLDVSDPILSSGDCK